MKYTPILELDGRLLYYIFVAGGQKIIESQTELNNINVFPVNDKDTGTNMASTVRAVLDNLRPNRSFKTTVNNIAEAALVGARGNSGIIFAQFLYGLSEETHDKKTITTIDFAESLQNAVKYIYEAVAKPMEGTILTVIKEWSAHIYSKKHLYTDFKQLLFDSVSVLKESLLRTQFNLDILSKSKVVDAGAKGFVAFIEGIVAFSESGNFRELLIDRYQNISIVHNEEVVEDNINFRYCTEAILKNINLNKAEVLAFLNKNGDSVVYAGSEKTARIHIHTNNPAELFFKLKDIGTITQQKVDDMIRQNEIAKSRKWSIALVTDSTCDLSPKLIDKYQIHSIPLNLNFGENHFLDKVTIQAVQFYEMLESSKVFPKTSQINERSFTNLYSHLASHYDAIISVHLTSVFSGTYSSSIKAAKRISEEFGKPIISIDSKNLSGGLGLIVLRIAQEIEKGSSFLEIQGKIEEWKHKTKIFVSVKTMKYMVKGGRVSPAKGLVSKILNVKPIVSVDESGNSFLFGKTFSQRSNMTKVIGHIRALAREQRIWNYVVLHAQNEAAAAWYVAEMRKITGFEPCSVVNISPVIGMNAGLGAASVAIMFH